MDLAQETQEAQAQVRKLIALAAYAVYCVIMYQFTRTFENTGSADIKRVVLVALPVFGVFAIIVTRGIFRWAQKKFPQEKRNK